jgi:hypothetical protein
MKKVIKLSLVAYLYCLKIIKLAGDIVMAIEYKIA